MIITRPKKLLLPTGTLRLNKADPLSKGLLGYWPLNDPGNLRNLVTGVPLAISSGSPTWGVGQNGSTIYFDGTDDGLIDSSFFFKAGTGITVSFWSNVPSPAQAADLFYIGEVDRILSHAPWSDGNLYWDYVDSSNGRISTSYANYLDKWTYVTLVNNGVDFKAIYFNGVLATSSSTVSANGIDRSTIFIGKQSSFHKGYINNFRVYDRALNQSEIARLYLDKHAGLEQSRRVFIASVAGGAQNGSASTRLTVKGSSVSTKISTSQTAPDILIRSSDVSTKIAESTTAPELLIRSSESSGKIAVGENSAEIILRSSSTTSQIAEGIQVGSASGTIVIRASGTATKIAESAVASEITLRSSTEATKQATAESVAELLLRGSITATQIAPGVQTGSASGRLFTRSSVAANKLVDGIGGAEITLRSAAVTTKSIASSAMGRMLIRGAVPLPGVPGNIPSFIAGIQSANMLYNFNNVNKLLGLRHAP